MKWVQNALQHKLLLFGIRTHSLLYAKPARWYGEIKAAPQLDRAKLKWIWGEDVKGEKNEGE